MRKAGYGVGRDQLARLLKILGIERVRRGSHRTMTDGTQAPPTTHFRAR